MIDVVMQAMYQFKMKHGFPPSILHIDIGTMESIADLTCTFKNSGFSLKKSEVRFMDIPVEVRLDWLEPKAMAI